MAEEGCDALANLLGAAEAHGLEARRALVVAGGACALEAAQRAHPQLERAMECLAALAADN